MDVRIKPLSKTDQSFLSEMLYLALFVPAGHEPLPREIIQHPDLVKYYQNWGKENDLGFIAFDARSNEKLGAIWIRQFKSENKGYGYINDHTPELSISVIPSLRGQGIGSLLMNALLDKVKNKYKAISLSVSVTNPAVRLYSRFGFKIVSEVKDAITMKKEFGLSN